MARAARRERTDSLQLSEDTEETAASVERERCVDRCRAARGFRPVAHVHFHILYLDGVYVLDNASRYGSPLTFHSLPTPSRAETAAIAGRIADRVEASARHHLGFEVTKRQRRLPRLVHAQVDISDDRDLGALCRPQYGRESARQPQNQNRTRFPLPTGDGSRCHCSVLVPSTGCESGISWRGLVSSRWPVLESS
jgi:hypothetical protein